MNFVSLCNPCAPMCVLGCSNLEGAERDTFCMMTGMRSGKADTHLAKASSARQCQLSSVGSDSRACSSCVNPETHSFKAVLYHPFGSKSQGARNTTLQVEPPASLKHDIIPFQAETVGGHDPRPRVTCCDDIQSTASQNSCNCLGT